MRMIPRSALLVAFSALIGCNKGLDPAIGRAAATQAAANVQRGLMSVQRLTQGLSEALRGAALPVGSKMADPAGVHRAMREIHDDHTALGRELSLYPTSFIAAVRPDGKAWASDRVTMPDPLLERDLAAVFPCVRVALRGAAGSCAGQFSLAEGVQRRWFVTAVPSRATADGPVNGAVVAAMTFGNIAKAVRGALDLDTTRDGVQLAVGLVHGGRTYPAGADNDVPAMYLVREPLVRAIPADVPARAARAPVTFTFAQNGGRMQWGAAAAPAPMLGDGASLLVFRAPVRQ